MQPGGLGLQAPLPFRQMVEPVRVTNPHCCPRYPGRRGAPCSPVALSAPSSVYTHQPATRLETCLSLNGGLLAALTTVAHRDPPAGITGGSPRHGVAARLCGFGLKCPLAQTTCWQVLAGRWPCRGSPQGWERCHGSTLQKMGSEERHAPPSQKSYIYLLLMQAAVRLRA